MKKILYLVLMVVGVHQMACAQDEQDIRFTTALTSGFVFKQDCLFKEVYGNGMVNILTADACYYPWDCWGIGAKVSYWRAKGCTTFLKRCSLVQEVPFTVYLRRIGSLGATMQVYASVGGGVTWIKEKSYLGVSKVHRGIGEAEVGVDFLPWNCFHLTTAFRYLFPRLCCRGIKRDFGGCDIRAGIGYSF